MKKLISLFLISVAFAMSSEASVLTTQPGTNEIKGVKIADKATLNVENQAEALDLVGAGIRVKLIFSVYVGQLFASDENKFVRTPEQALSSLEQSKNVAIQMTFLRTVQGDDIQKAFRDAMMKNDVDVDNASIKAFLDAIKNGGEVTQGQTLLVATNKLDDGSEVLFYENGKGQLTRVPAEKGASEKIWKLWFGEPADAGVTTLRDAILSYKK